MSSRLDISNQIEKDLKDSLQASRGYNFTPAEIKRGLHKFNDFSLKPSIGFSLVSDVPDGIGSARIFTYVFYGYTDTSDWENSDDIYKLLEDIEDFMDSDDNTYKSCGYIQEINIVEGGTSQPVNSFEMFVDFTFDLD
jgi:hypothetical protein